MVEMKSQTERPAEAGQPCRNGSIIFLSPTYNMDVSGMVGGWIWPGLVDDGGGGCWEGFCAGLGGRRGRFFTVMEGLMVYKFWTRDFNTVVWWSSGWSLRRQM